MSETHHASAVLLPAGGVLLLGPSGSGKSGLAAQLIQNNDAKLIADDRVALKRHATKLIARPPSSLTGKLELRGLGIVAMPHIDEAEIVLAVDLVARGDVPRVAAENHFAHDGVAVPKLALCAFDIATPAAITHALAHLPTIGFNADGVYSAS